MVPKYPAARTRINRNGSDSSGSEISCDTGHFLWIMHWAGFAVSRSQVFRADLHIQHRSDILYELLVS